MKQRHLHPLWPVTVVGLLVGSRILRLSEDFMYHDEVRSISRTFGTPWQIVSWQPIDWPPLYYLLLAAYRMVVGFHPVVMRYSSVLLFALSLALVYRAGARLLGSRWAGLCGVAAYGSLGTILYQSTNVRGYALALALFALAFWLTARYFDAAAPRWRRALPLALVLMALFYTTYTVVFGYLVLVAYTLLAYPARRSWRWWRPAVIALPLAAPQLWRLGNYMLPLLYRRETARLDSPEALPANSTVLGYLWEVVRGYVGGAYPVWIGLVGLIAVVLLVQRRRVPRRVWALVGLAAVSPLVATTLGRFLGMVGPHYSWWAVFALAWLAGYALGALPRVASGVGLAMLVAVPFVPMSMEGYGYGNVFRTPMEANFTWLSERVEPGDVLYIDESCDAYEMCGTAEEWDYYQMVYFPNRRLNIVDNPQEAEAARRVWYVHASGWHDEASEAQLQDGRVAGAFVGPWDFLFQLYEAPPDPVGVLYENGLRFHGYDVLDDRLGGGYVQGPVVRREGESVRLRLWWSVDRRLTRDYSLSALIAIDADGDPLWQMDGPPQVIEMFPQVDVVPPSNTSAWETDRYYVEDRVIALPNEIDSDLRDRPLGIYLTVYQWWDGEIIQAPSLNALGRRLLRTMFVLAY